MQGNLTMNDQSRYEWGPHILVLPRIGLFLNRSGVRRHLLWPGAYLVRMSRSMGKRIYRRPPLRDRDD